MSKLHIFGDAPREGLGLAMGNFDGVHRGHQSVFDAARSAGEWGVVSFAPHPRRFFAPDAPRFELMNPSTQARIIREMGAYSFDVHFDEALASMPAIDFLTAIGETFAPKRVAVGADFRYGKDRGGDVALVQEWGAENDVDIVVARLATDGGEKISSSAIREALQNGNPALAASMLGRPHIVNGVVSQGDQRGRDLGFPTANLIPHDVMLPKFGVYATRLKIHSGRYFGEYLGASSVGVRPQFGKNAPNFETHILDFDGDIYGVEISVELIEYLRPELTFDSIEALIMQMRDDVARCREILT